MKTAQAALLTAVVLGGPVAYIDHFGLPEFLQAAEARPTRSDSKCHSSYQGKCVPKVRDVDCAGGAGDGPAFVGRVIVVGPDVYGLDYDGDGIGCE